MRFNFNTQQGVLLLTVGDLSFGDLFVRESLARSISERTVYIVANDGRPFFGMQEHRIACVSLRDGYTHYLPPNTLARQLEGELTLELM